MAEAARKPPQQTDPGTPLSLTQRIGLVLGPVLFLLILLFLRPAGMSSQAVGVLATTCWLATWWITEPIPIPATSLLPIILFPVLGATSIRDATLPYADPTIFLFLGGFLIALAIEKWNLHRRIALNIIKRIGVSPQRLVLGFMVATGLLSAFISNSATAMMMLPIGMAVLSQVLGMQRGTVSKLDAEGKPPKTNFGAALMLGIAYAASIGGVATLIGTPPNAALKGIAQVTLGYEIGFLEWMILAVPIVVIFMAITWWILLKLLPPEFKDIPGGREIIDKELAALGPMTQQERRVLAVFATTGLLWIIRPFLLNSFVPDDAVIAVLGGLALFLIPSGLKKGETLLDASAIGKLPWGVLLLFGGGFSLANGFKTSGLADWIANNLVGLKSLPYFVLLLIVCAVMIFLTEVTSNTAVANIFLPILASLGPALGVSPIPLMATAAIAASFAFMLPVATPPNAIVFSTGYFKIADMAKIGFWLNITGIVVISILCYFWLPIAWGM